MPKEGVPDTVGAGLIDWNSYDWEPCKGNHGFQVHIFEYYVPIHRCIFCGDIFLDTDCQTLYCSKEACQDLTILKGIDGQI